MDVMLSAIGIVLAVDLIIYLSYIGYSPLLVAPIAAVIICLFSSYDPVAGLITDYSTGFGNMVRSVLLTYLTCCMFARIMVQTKAAYSVAEWIANLIG